MLLTIEKLIYGGDGLARLPARSPSDDRGRGKAVFVPLVLAGEEIEAALTEQKPGFARAHAESIIEASPHRVPPDCEYFGRCGGCHYQHASYEHQLEIKKEILRENLRRIAKLELQTQIEVHPSPPWNYRNRSRLQLQTKPTFAAGYFKLGSHELMPVEQCPVSSPLINRGIAALWQIGRAKEAAGQALPGLHEIEFFANADDTQLLAELSCSAGTRRADARGFVEELRATLPEILGVVAFRVAQANKEKPNRAQSSKAHSTVRTEPAPLEPLLTNGERYLTYRTAHASHRVSSGAFFQTNRHLTDELVKIVTEGRSGELALDLYAGVGLFSTALAGDFRHIVSVESSQLSAGDLRYNLPSNGKAIQAATGQYLSRSWDSSPRHDSPPHGPPRQGSDTPAPTGEGSVASSFPTPDLVVVDPPRSGLGEPVARSLTSLGAPRVTYVSCDPATLARDLIPLLAAGYRVEQAHLVDLFPQTYHLESVLHLVR
ncbi:MAG: class I SAM-dependent RNA methyltransferase [Candidatus Sulfotelmatobacter sp.]